MLVHISALLADQVVAELRGRLIEAEWGDGGVTAGHQSVKVKANLQIGPDSPVGRELGLVL